MSLKMRGQKKIELAIYVILWAMLFAAAALSVYVEGVSPIAEDAASGVIGYDWTGLMNSWRLLALFCSAFFIHNFFIAPLLVYRDLKWQYCGLVLLLLAVFVAIMLPQSPNPPKDDRPALGNPPHEMSGDLPPELPYMMPHEMHHGISYNGLRHDRKGFDSNPMKAKPFGGPTTVAFIILILLLGLNVGTKYYFKSLDDRKRMKDLERDNLNRQLQYLKYQISPHFFMNTLNNIHALVDIDPEEAKHTIEVLSKLMRYVLYDADKPMAPLRKELDFMGYYINLMRIRYTDKVRITVSTPDSVPDIYVPSLLFTTFVENAFKHGVSYQKDSFIEVSVEIDEMAGNLEFICNNSRRNDVEEAAKPSSRATQGGVGLCNAVQRLRLIYGSEYELKIDDDTVEYRLMLRIPFRCIVQ